MFRKLWIKWQVRRRRAVDIWSSGGYPSTFLSNLCDNMFFIDDVFCQSMEGFLESLKYDDFARQQQICNMKGRKAKKRSNTDWQTDQIVWWKGVAINRQSEEFQLLLRRAYQALFDQNERFRIALMSTRGMKLYHSRGKSDSFKTILTEEEFCTILTDMRDAYINCLRKNQLCNQRQNAE